MRRQGEVLLQLQGDSASVVVEYQMWPDARLLFVNDQRVDVHLCNLHYPEFDAHVDALRWWLDQEEAA